ncbi:hypothetical protein [Antarcticibacterium arcticum]|uniref:hypothetical protein n=1 Tax=Antarcticibacterium arcticum TaxID=2585771 RepID=UPI00143D3881|nr:hypothetical protein [Antarcticibacterium arcticum]
MNAMNVFFENYRKATHGFNILVKILIALILAFIFIAVIFAIVGIVPDILNY